MSDQITLPGGSRRIARSAWAVFVGFVSVAVLSLAMDQLLHTLKVYPPWGEAMYDPALNALALSYRIAFTVLGGYLTARLAPHGPMGHAWTLGFVGLAAGALAAITSIPMHLGPAWYPVAIAMAAMPCSWLGGKAFVARA